MSVNAVNKQTGNLLPLAGTQTYQFSTMPTASVDNLNKIIQYVGDTTSSYTNGYFYKCIYDETVTPAVYRWENIAVATIPTVSVSHTGTASSTGVRKEVITINNVNYDVDGSAYMEQSVTLSTSAATTVTFTNAIIADGAMLTMASSLWDLVPDNMTTAVGSCTITLPKWSTAETIGVRLYVR